MLNAWFASDLHLRRLNERNAVVFLNFVNSLGTSSRPASHLFLLGDVFDFWVGGESGFYQSQYGEIFQAILMCQSRGVEVVYFEGNHDVHVLEFWKERGVRAFVEAQEFKLGPWRVHCEHGDLINPEDTVYLRYRDFIRSRPLRKLADWLPSKKLFQVGEVASLWSRKRRKHKFSQAEFAARITVMIRSYAEELRRKKTFDYFIAGHMHVRDTHSFVSSEATKCTAINLGSWYDEPTVLLLTDSGHHWVKLP